VPQDCAIAWGVGEYWIRLDLSRLGHDLVGCVVLGWVYTLLLFPYSPFTRAVGIGVKYEVFFFSP